MFGNGRRRNGRYDDTVTKLKCPLCHKKIMAGAVTIVGERYKCISCNAWFKMENDKLKYIDFWLIK